MALKLIGWRCPDSAWITWSEAISDHGAYFERCLDHVALKLGPLVAPFQTEAD